jgi:hypothetical protein
MDDGMDPIAVRRRAYEPATVRDMHRYAETSTMLGNDPMQLDGALQFQILHLGEIDEDGRADFLDVAPIGSSPTDVGAIALVQEHHDVSGDSRALWFLRGAGRSGEEIHAGHGHGLHATTRYRIVMVRTRNER